MKFYSKLIIIIILFSSFSFSQIIDESTVQVVAYWETGEVYTYDLISLKEKTNGSEIESSNSSTVSFDFKILDETETSYEIEMLYHSLRIESDDILTSKLASLTDSLKIVAITNEMGAFQEVKNWKEIRIYMNEAISILKDELNELNILSIDELNQIFNQFSKLYQTKESIESQIIEDLSIFLTYHGGLYTREAIHSEIKSPNIYQPDKPFDTKVRLKVERIDEDDNTFNIYMLQEIDSDQLKEASLEFLKKIADESGNPITDNLEKARFLNETEITSIIHGSGWPIRIEYSKTVDVQDTRNLETKLIMMRPY